MIRFVSLLALCAFGGLTLGASPAHDAMEIRPLSPLRAQQFFADSARNMQGIAVGGQRLRVADRQVVLSKREGAVWAQLEDGRPFKVDGQQPLFAPIHMHLPVLPFDILLPFFGWPEPQYEGPGNILGRQTHRFSVSCDTAGPVAKVYVWIDARFAYPLAWDAFDANGNLVRQFRVRSFGKDADRQWNVKRVQLIDNQSRRHISIEVLNF